MKLFAILMFVLFSSYTHASYIEKVRDKKILIYLDGLKVQKGDLVNVLEPIQKKTVGIFRITTVKDGKAIGVVVRGRARVNYEITSRKTKGQTVDRTKRSKEKEEKPKETVDAGGTYAIGGMLGVGFDSMDIKIGSPVESVSQSGMGFSLSGVFDYRLNPWLSLRGTLGFEQFKVSGNASSASPCTSCQTEFTLLSTMAWGRVHVTQTETTIWVGPGMGYVVPMGTKSNALDVSSIKNMLIFGAGGGVDIAFNPKMYIPIQLEYVFLNNSEDVKATYYAIKAGVVFKF